jgi:two-component system nitrate/nitrite response regulator NarL
VRERVGVVANGVEAQQVLAQLRETVAEREQAVLRCVADGMSNKLIARTLAITEGTVKVHVKHVLKKLSFRCRVEAAVWAAEQGLRSAPK